MQLPVVRLQRLSPLVVALVLIVGNVFPRLPVWGFNYHVLALPPSLAWLGVAMTFLVGLYPAVAPGGVVLRCGYMVVALVTLSLLMLNLVLIVGGLLLNLPNHGTPSVFSGLPLRGATFVLLIIYVTWSFRLAGLEWAATRFIFWSVTCSALVAYFQFFEALSFITSRHAVVP